jgi:Ni,Fe-hydrogenase I large subunit
MANYVVDPVVRIEGHLALDVDTNSAGIVTGVQCQTKLFRGFELIMRDRNPRDAVIITQRI